MHLEGEQTMAATEQNRLVALKTLSPLQAIQAWLKKNRVPAERVLAVEKATGVPRHQLRPDLYPPEDLV